MFHKKSDSCVCRKGVWGLLLLLLILGFFGYRSYRASFVYPVHMQEPGVFQSHPDNAYPDKMADSPRDFLE